MCKLERGKMFFKITALNTARLPLLVTAIYEIKLTPGSL